MQSENESEEVWQNKLESFVVGFYWSWVWLEWDFMPWDVEKVCDMQQFKGNCLLHYTISSNLGSSWVKTFGRNWSKQLLLQSWRSAVTIQIIHMHQRTLRTAPHPWLYKEDRKSGQNLQRHSGKLFSGVHTPDRPAGAEILPWVRQGRKKDTRQACI